MNIFHHNTISFSDVDPLGDGLGDEIAAEQHEADSIKSLDDVSAEELTTKWTAIVEDIKKDPTWFDFSEE
jgi:hypothetical protein